MRNFVAKHDFNRASTHKSLKDYTRVTSQEVMDTVYEELEDSWDDFGIPKMEEDWALEHDDEEDLPFKNPSDWEFSNNAIAKFLLNKEVT